MSLDRLREIVNSTNSPTDLRDDPRDAVGKASVARSEMWLKENTHIPKDKLYGRWKTEVKAGARITNRETVDYFWDVEKNLHPKGPKFAERDYMDNIHEKLNKMDDAGKKNFLKDIAREAPSPVLNNLLLDYSVLNQKESEKTKERARLANLNSFSNMVKGFSQKFFTGESIGLNPEVSISSHAEDLVKAWSADRDDVYINGDGRMCITSEEGQPEVPLYALEESSLTWEEAAINAHDLLPIAKRQLKSALTYSRNNAKTANRLATMELAEDVQNQPREFQSSIIVDGAEISKDPMTSIRESINRIVVTNMGDGLYNSVRDITRDFIARFDEVSKTIEARSGDGLVSHTRRG